MSTRAALIAATVAAACGSHDAPAPSPAPVPVDAGVRTPVVSADCRAAIQAGNKTALDARVIVLLNACQVCGPWTPILDWRRPHPQGGPTRAEIEAAMLGCNAYCDPNAKQRFLGTLDDARGANSRAPWRWLAETCKAAVSAVPDTRYGSAPLFALDRVARAVGSAGGPEALALSQLAIPLPALSISGVGVELPRSTAVEATAPRAQITVTANDVRGGLLPVGHLTKDGVVTDYGGTGEAIYPGALLAIGGGGPGSAAANVANVALTAEELVILAPAKLPAERVADVVRHLANPRVLLGVAVDGPDGWELVGTIAVSLRDPDATAPKRAALRPQTVTLAGAAPSDLKLDPAAPVRVLVAGPATVSDLSDLLTNLHALGIKQITLRTGRAADP